MEHQKFAARLDLRFDKLDRQLVGICRTNETCRRFSKLPGVGPVIATALIAAVDDRRHFRSPHRKSVFPGGPHFATIGATFEITPLGVPNRAEAAGRSRTVRHLTPNIWHRRTRSLTVISSSPDANSTSVSIDKGTGKEDHFLGGGRFYPVQWRGLFCHLQLGSIISY
jgi:hypothetical protein